VNKTLFYDSIFYLPSYPIQDICLNYTNNCLGYISKVLNNTLNINLNPICSDTKNGLFLHPSTIQRIEILLLRNISVDFQSTPNNMMNSSDSTYRTVCPEGFVLPDTPESDRNAYVMGMYVYMYIYVYKYV
jgi:hypothetical protein